MHTECSRYLVDLRSRFRLNSPEFAFKFFRSKITDQTSQNSVCLSLDYEKLQDWLNKTVYNANCCATVNLHSEIVVSLDSGAEEPGITTCARESYEHKTLPNEGGDDPTIPSDLSPAEVHSLLLNAMHAQEKVNTASDHAMLQSEAQIEFQKETGEPFPADDINDPAAAASGDDVHLPPMSMEPHTPAAMDVDDSATSVALTEAVNPGYSVCPLLRLRFRVLGLRQRRVNLSLAPA